MGNIYELGGFATELDDIDGTEDEFNAFNFCLAEEYFSAMEAEDFESLGEIDLDLVHKIVKWLNYDGTINKKSEINQIKTGLFLTNRNRTFIDAIIENKNVAAAETYILLGSRDIRLYIIYKLYNRDNYIDDREEYISYMRSFFEAIDNTYNKLNKKEKLKFLNVLKDNINLFAYPKKYGEIKVSEIGDYNWIKKLKLIN